MSNSLGSVGQALILLVDPHIVLDGNLLSKTLKRIYLLMMRKGV